MEEIDLTPEPKWFVIGKKKYNIARISAERSLKAAAMYNRKIKGIPDSDSFIPYPDTYSLVVSLLDCVFLLFRVDFLSNPWEWFRRGIVTKKHILKTIDHKSIMEFVEDALEPIIGDKKKELNRQDKMADAMLLIMDTITPEALSVLLLNSLQAQDIKKNIS